jgi:hypothetical protein
VTKPPNKRDIQSFLEDADEHNPDNVLIMITNTLSPDTKDWIEAVKLKRKYPFNILYWEELDLEREVTNYRPQISERFPKIYSRADPVTVEQVIKKEEYVFSCREFAEINLVVIDKSNLGQAREEVIEFIKFLKENDVNFTWLQNKKHRK